MSISLSLAPYAGPFTRREAGHLLRRTSYGVRRERVEEAIELGVAGTLDKLFEAREPMAPPVNPYYEDDPEVPVGAVWVNKPRTSGVNSFGYEAQSIYTWQFRCYLRDEFSITGRMALFWHNHFGVNLSSGDGRHTYRYLDRLRNQALGNFRRLVEDTTVDAVMLRFLDGQSSQKGNPNENYARELLELFTVGKGEQVGEGDYTTYTEDDIRAIANKLTGWIVRSPPEGGISVGTFEPRRHDPTPRQLSPRFGNAELVVEGEDAYKEVVEVVFAHPLVAHYLCRKLYRTFVHYDIDDAVEAAIIDPLAALLRDSDFEVAPVLRRLLASEHFFDIRERGALIKSPLDYFADLFYGLPYPTTPTTTGTSIPLTADHNLHFYYHNQLASMEMRLREPPTVAGWKAWYQAPQYNRVWINASTLGYRTRLASLMVQSRRRDGDGNEYRLELLPFIANFEDPADPNALVAELAERLLSEPLDEAQLTALKDVLIPGLPDFEWTVEYNHHLDDPDDDDLRQSVRKRVHDVVYALVTSAEFHLY